MKFSTLALGIVIALCVSHGQTKKHNRHRQTLHHTLHHASQTGQLESEIRSEREEAEKNQNTEETGDAPDPCGHFECQDGEHCSLTSEGQAQCVCIDNCAKYNDPRSAVCSSRNVTYDSECEFYRQMCLCTKKEAGCQDYKILEDNDHLDYYGTCQNIQACTSEELSVFPNRMAKWLTNVMETLDRRQELDIKFSDMHRRSRRTKNPEIVPVLWEFCQMDTSKDRIVTRSELFPLMAPLKSLEHCIGNFLDGCDANSNGEITLAEWGRCLNIPADKIEDICEGVDVHHVRLQG